jgi:hypothetical protein
LDETVSRLSEFSDALQQANSQADPLERERHRQSVHWALICMLNFRRLRQLGLIAVPEARFAFIQQRYTFKKWLLFGDTQVRFGPRTPAIIQERVPGVSIWDMFDPPGSPLGRLKASSGQERAIADQLRPVLSSDLYVDVFDLNPKNFIFDYHTERLWYVESKPTTAFLEYGSNTLNLKMLRERFFNYQCYGRIAADFLDGDSMLLRNGFAYARNTVIEPHRTLEVLDTRDDELSFSVPAEDGVIDAVGTTWRFTRAGHVFRNGDYRYTTIRERATIDFRADGVLLRGFRINWVEEKDAEANARRRPLSLL